MTTAINNIPIENNVQPNNDIQDPLVQEILDNMAKSSETQNSSQQPIQQPVPQSVPQQINTVNQPIYNYPTQDESFLTKFYDKKIMILTLFIITVVILFHLNQFEEFILTIDNVYIQQYKFYIKYIVLYLIIYIIQKYGF